MKPNPKHQKCGIYCIRNIINNKVYIGKSKNIYKRIHQHIYDLKNKRIENENSYLLNSWYKYGEDAFDYYVIEFLECNEELVAERELYWMKVYNSLIAGYNLRSDSNSRMIVHKSTSLKISNRLKEEWTNGIRSNHGLKLANNWKNNPDRKTEQSKILTKNLTKYTYKIDNEYFNYKELCDIGFKNSISTFHRKKSNIIIYKNTQLERIKIDDIVRHS